MTSEPPVVAQLLGWAAIGFLLLLALLVGIASEAVRKGRLPVVRRRRLLDRLWRDE